jgi:hypothetical protein
VKSGVVSLGIDWLESIRFEHFLSSLDGLVLHVGLETLSVKDLQEIVYEFHQPNSHIEFQAFVVKFERSFCIFIRCDIP